MRIARRGIAALALACAVMLSASVEARRNWSSREGGEPGNFDYYLMSLSWSPTYCADIGQRDGGPQCNGPRPYAFVLHGLWPQYNRGWPEFCQTRDRPWVPQRTIDDMLDIMPSKQLIIHEYKKHGTCSGLSPEAYFDLARRAYSSVKIPQRYQRPDDALQVSPGEVVDDFVKANPGLRPEMIAITCDQRLRELHICLDRDLRPQACGGNETGRSQCSRDRVTMPPVRAGRF
jgi:ribonuclease T2